MTDDIAARLRDDLKIAMKEGDKKRVSTLRLMTSALKDREIAARTEMSDPASSPGSGPIDVFARMVKQRQESITVYEKGGRPELAENERVEIAIIQNYMPAQMSQAEITTAINDAVMASGAAGIKDMGKIMDLMKEKFTGRLDMAQAGALVRARLSSSS